MKKIKKENKQVKAKLMPIGKDGKEVDWFYGWPGIEKLTKSLGKSWIDVGELIENTWGDRTSMTDINFAHVIYILLIFIHNLSAYVVKSNDRSCFKACFIFSQTLKIKKYDFKSLKKKI